jgi:hypothetical protein
MSLWKSEDAASNAPVYTVASGYGISANGSTLYENANLQVSIATGVYGVDTTEAGITTGDGKKVAHAGWNLARRGTGGVLSITANTGAYSNAGNVYLTFTGGGTGNTTANAQVFINVSSNLITSVVVHNPGSYMTTPTITPITGAGNGVGGAATFTATMAGRANRVSYETLVAMGSMTGDGDDTYFPDT